MICFHSMRKYLLKNGGTVERKPLSMAFQGDFSHRLHIE